MNGLCYGIISCAEYRRNNRTVDDILFKIDKTPIPFLSKINEGKAAEISRQKNRRTTVGKRVSQILGFQDIRGLRPIIGQKIDKKELPAVERVLNLISVNQKITRKECEDNSHIPFSTVQFYEEN